MTPQFSLGVESSDVFWLIVFAVVALLTSSIAAERNRTHAVRVGEGNGTWQSVETYLAETPDLHISHALCPECSARHFPEFRPHG